MKYTEILEVKRNDVLIDGAVGCIIMILHNCNNNKNKTFNIRNRKGVTDINSKKSIFIKQPLLLRFMNTFHKIIKNQDH